ncbi:PH domain-containing protein [Kitasatospora sp. NPDC093558]|uniref:PH domain-containing protein n=1 Tax=Kitasatospora sp. NPDC093558 TaxID=3155201 RepID=UPI0034433E44
MIIVAVGLVFFLISVEGIALEPLGAKIMYAVILVLSVGWIHQGARIGLVIGPGGIVERSMGRPHRIAWPDVAEVAVATSGPGVSMIVLRLRDGRAVQLRGTAGYRKKRVEDIERRLNAFRSAAIGPTGD